MRTSRALVLAVSVVAAAAATLSTAPLASAGVTPADVTGSLTPNPVVFPALKLGATSAAQEVTLTNNGTDPLIVGGAAVVVDGAPDDGSADSFKITADGCATATLAATESCTVSVVAHPFDLGDITASLQIPDNSAAGIEQVPLQVTSTDVTHGLYYPVATSRILDTRSGLGASKHTVKAGKTVALQVLGKGHVPTGGASAVVLNLTVTHAASGGHVIAYAGGTSRPTISSINFAKGWTGANLVTVPIGTNGKVNLYNSSSSVDLIADVQGWYASSDAVSAVHGVGGAFGTQSEPFRLIDTRTDGGHHPLPAGWSEEVAAYYDAPDVGPNDIHALAITLTGTNVKAGGYMTATDINSNPTKTSTLNLHAGVTTPNLAIVKAEPCTEDWCGGDFDPTSQAFVFQVFNGSSHAVDFIADLQGAYWTDNLSHLRYQNIKPTRIVDSRIPRGTTKLGAKSTHYVVAPPSVNAFDTFAMSSNFTAVSPTERTYLTVWPKVTGHGRPLASNLNPTAHETVATGAMINIGDDQSFGIYNSSGSTNVLVDVTGQFNYFPSLTTLPNPPAARAAVAARQATVRAQVNKQMAALGAVRGGSFAARPWAGN